MNASSGYRICFSGALLLALGCSQRPPPRLRPDQGAELPPREIGTIQYSRTRLARHRIHLPDAGQHRRAPDSYHPDDIGITHICNGVSVGRSCTEGPVPARLSAAPGGGRFAGPTKICFFAMVSDPRGVPGSSRAAPTQTGYYVSTTALHQPGADPRTPEAQLDSNTVPSPSSRAPGSAAATLAPSSAMSASPYRRSNGKLAYFLVATSAPETNSAKLRGPAPGPRQRSLRRTASVNAVPTRASRRRRDLPAVPRLRPPRRTPRRESIERVARPLLDRFRGIDRLEDLSIGTNPAYRQTSHPALALNRGFDHERDIERQKSGPIAVSDMTDQPEGWAGVEGRPNLRFRGPTPGELESRPTNPVGCRVRSASRQEWPSRSGGRLHPQRKSLPLRSN